MILHMNTPQQTKTDNPGFAPNPARQQQKNRQADNGQGRDLPHWIRNDERWRRLPREIREATQQVLVPAYRQFVLDAPSEIERTVGLTLVHLTWLELCDQIKLAAAAEPDSLESVLENPRDALDRHLRLTIAKCQTAGLLQKLQIVQTTLRRGPVVSLPALPPFPLSIENKAGEPQPRRSEESFCREPTDPPRRQPLSNLQPPAKMENPTPADQLDHAAPPTAFQPPINRENGKSNAC
jgi:hypothetical protein